MRGSLAINCCNELLPRSPRCKDNGAKVVAKAAMQELAHASSTAWGQQQTSLWQLASHRLALEPLWATRVGPCRENTIPVNFMSMTDGALTTAPCTEMSRHTTSIDSPSTLYHMQCFAEIGIDVSTAAPAGAWCHRPHPPPSGRRSDLIACAVRCSHWTCLDVFDDLVGIAATPSEGFLCCSDVHC